MDKRINNGGKWQRKWLLWVVAILILGFGSGFYLSGTSDLRLNAADLTISTITQSQFYEYINLDGRIEPTTTYLIDSKIDGNVDRLYVTSGQQVQRGDTLLRLANADLELEVMQRESQLIEQLNAQRQTRLLLNQNDFNRRERVVEINYQLSLTEKQYRRDTQLERDSLIATRDYEPTANRYAYYKARQQLLTSALKTDSLARQRQLQQIDAFEVRILENLTQVRAILDRLYLLAPTTGSLSNFSIQIGQSIASGQRIGEIFSLNDPIVTAEVDEFYLNKISTGQPGLMTYQSDTLSLKVDKIYPSVTNGRFRIDARITSSDSSATASFVKGQSLRFRLLFGREESSVLLANGGFYSSTGGHWIYRLGPNGAERTPIRLGRSNPNYYEVLEGLEPGDQVIVSAYDGYEQYESITINTP